MSTMADHNLLTGAIALQMGLVTGEQLVTAINDWAVSPETPLLDVLLRRVELSAKDVDALRGGVERHRAGVENDTACMTVMRVDPEVTMNLSGDSDAPPALTRVVEPDKTVLALGDDVAPAAAQPGSGAERFRRVRPHARGGLGEVSVAVDEELHREVALKEILPTYAGHLGVRARFVREAEITGQLEHPGVVPIYGLGVTAEGLPYYAMRFIRGESLEEAMRRYHGGKPDPLEMRRMLARFVGVCNTLAFAHNKGVIHRDIKPANIMLGEYGETLVVDWGLARTAQDVAHSPIPDAAVEITGDPSMTHEGQVVGTPAFMPPEQAQGALADMGPHSDVWALGATLYAILTNKAPYSGRTALSDAAACPPRPVRSLSCSAHPALDAICRKAMARDPKKRYASARDLAADVERWLADEPVSAYSDPISVRLARWGRKHRTLVTAVGVVLVSGIAALAIGLAAVGREQVKTVRALGQAEANLKLARKAVDECFNIARDHSLLQGGGMLEVKKLLLAKALPFYRDFQASGDRTADEEAADAFYRVGFIMVLVGDQAGALKAHEQARDLYAKLAKAHSKVPAHRRDLAMALNSIGLLLRDLGRRDEALKALERARELQEALVDEQKEVLQHRHELANTLNGVALVLEDQGKKDKALKAHEQALKVLDDLVGTRDLLEYRQALARTLYNLAVLHQALGHRDKALKAHERALAIREKLASAHRAVTAYRYDLAMSLNGLGVLLKELNRRDDALKAYERARALFEQLAAANPDAPEYRHLLAGTHTNRANLLIALDRKDEGRKAHEQARDLLDTLAADHPEVTVYSQDLAESLTSLGVQCVAAGRRDEALLAYERARGIQARLASANPATASYRQDLGNTLYNLACLFALDAGKSAVNVRRPAALRSQEVEMLARESLENLRSAKRNGLFADAKVRQTFAEDADFAALRGRPDFKEFVASLPKP